MDRRVRRAWEEAASPKSDREQGLFVLAQAENKSSQDAFCT